MTEFLSPIPATTLNEAFGTSWDFLLKGGVFMIPLALTSVIGVTAILYKFLSLSRSRVVPDALAGKVADFQELAAADRIEPVLKEFEKGDSTLARLASVAVRHRGKPQRDIILAVEASAREETARLHAGIGVLDIVITVAPLLGLLGTASGLVHIFKGLSDTADHLAIARGIAMALNTTIFGLAIAVPCVVAHGYFTRRIEVLTARLESLLADLAHVCQRPGKQG
ncbi:MAG: MotA/TolQ/ExbB proton channel family protein [Akkermansiaceae bacterium]|jgi:biopolymer transport protein ExbB|nr:MotA/TolQ/ExbB proton channel family protein [Akkermansiaceae bacterium]MCU0777651.1 MotA/TolQ/ExbB proton channel family protein [Akkermansiaceae bacterium]